MPRTARITPGGMVFHMLNRTNARARIFTTDEDYAAFERVMKERNTRTCDAILRRKRR